jgi:hypothetical protein
MAGKGRIENLRPFKKGESGNPKGRPPGVVAEIKRLAGKDGRKLVAVLYTIACADDEVFVKMFGDKAKRTIHDRREAAQDLLDRLHGRPAQAILHGSDPENPLAVPTIVNHFAKDGAAPTP